MNYDYKYVAFIDILGFKNIVNKSSENEELLKRVDKIVRFLKNEQDEYYDEMKEHFPDREDYYKEISVFSDSVIISYSAKNQIGILFHILNDLSYIVNNLLVNGFLVRGGITFGKCIHEENVCYGEALNRAVALESEANYPRIVIDEDAFSLGKILHADHHTEEMEQEYLDGMAYIDEDGDGSICLNNLAFGVFSDEDEFLQMLRIAKQQLLKMENENNDAHILEKIEWAIRYYNNTLNRYIIDESLKNSLLITI